MGASACQKSLAEFAARRRQRNKIIFSRDMCVRENTARAASVEFVRHGRTNYARSRPQAFCRKNPGGFFDSLKPPFPASGEWGLGGGWGFAGTDGSWGGSLPAGSKVQDGGKLTRPAKIAAAARLPRPVAGPPPPGPGPGGSETGPSNLQRNCRRRCQKNG